MATSQFNTLTLQVLTPLALPVSEQVSTPGANTQALDAVLLPWVTAQAAMDAVRSVATYSQPSLLSVAVDGQLGVLTAQGTITYTAPSGAQTITIGGVAVGAGFTSSGNAPADAITAANLINGSVVHDLVAKAIVNPANSSQVIVIARYPGPGMNQVGLLVSGVGAAASAATLGGSAVAPARAGTASSQVNTLGIGTPAFP